MTNNIPTGRGGHQLDSRLNHLLRGPLPLPHPNSAAIERDRLAFSNFAPDAVLDGAIHPDLAAADHRLGHSTAIAEPGCFQKLVEFDVVAGYFKYFQEISIPRKRPVRPTAIRGKRRRCPKPSKAIVFGSTD